MVSGVNGPPQDPWMEEGTDLPRFALSRDHQFIVEVYSDNLHHNYGTHLDGGIAYCAIYKRLWRRLATQLSRWYAMPTRTTGQRFMDIMVVNWQGIFNCKYNSKKYLIFYHVILTTTMVMHRVREIQKQIRRRLII